MEKPKRVITPEQQEKMRLGRQRAYEERKAKKEAEKNAKKEEKERQKAIQQQALQEQKDRRRNLKEAVEKRQEQKEKLASLKQKKVEPITEDNFFDEDNYDQEEAELPLKIAIEEPYREPTNKEYKEKFLEEAEKVVSALPHGSKTMFRNATKKFDYNLSVEENIKSMIEYVKEVVNKNVSEVARLKAKIETKPLKEKPVVKEVPEVVEAEQIIESKMKYLMTKYR